MRKFFFARARILYRGVNPYAPYRTHTTPGGIRVKPENLSQNLPGLSATYKQSISMILPSNWRELAECERFGVIFAYPPTKRLYGGQKSIWGRFFGFHRKIAYAGVYLCSAVSQGTLYEWVEVMWSVFRMIGMIFEIFENCSCVHRDPYGATHRPLQDPYSTILDL